MSDITRGIIEGFLEAFNAYTIKDPVLQGQVDSLRQRMMEFAKKNTDVTSFYPKLAESGLQEEYSGLIGKVAMAAMGASDAGATVETDYTDTSAPPTISVRDFVEQYRVPYNEVKKAAYRKRAEAVYERILSLADTTDDMLEAQTILEEERLLWKVISEDAIDIFEPILEALDPLQAMSITVEKHLEAYKTVQASEELDYALEKLEVEKLPLIQQGINKINIAAQVARLTIGYIASKLNTQQSGGQGEQGKNALYTMIGFRNALRRTIRFMKEELDLTIDELLADEGAKIWLLSPINVDELGRIKITLNPQNYEVIKEVIEKEITSELTTIEILQLTPEKMFWFGFEGEKYSAYNRKAEKQASQLNASLTYYKYKGDLGSIIGQFSPVLESSK